MNFKRTIFALLLTFVCVAVFAQQGTTPATPAPQNAPAQQKPAISLKFESVVKDFGDIKQNVPASFEFKFTNVSKTPQVISDVVKSCGCTQPEFSKEPILPGKSSVVKATYNAAALGNFNKTLTVRTVDQEVYTLTVKGNVLADPAATPATPPVVPATPNK
jgi:hypothetical protein